MVNQALLQPQEIEVFYIIPTLKKSLAVCMKGDGLKQNEIAKLLQTEKATISHYINNKRGNKVQFDDYVLDEISKSASKIEGKLSLLKETQRLLRFVRSSGQLCKIHKQLSDIPGECSPEVVNCFGE
jgi:predicted transcriptional regulator